MDAHYKLYKELFKNFLLFFELFKQKPLKSFNSNHKIFQLNPKSLTWFAQIV